jgi:hypothetical protein
VPSRFERAMRCCSGRGAGRSGAPQVQGLAAGAAVHCQALLCASQPLLAKGDPTCICGLLRFAAVCCYWRDWLYGT